MIGKSLFVLTAFLGALLAVSAGAVTTSQNVDIIVTHGAALTTFTFQNDTGATLPAGTPVTFAQAFRYGDIMPGTHPVIRDAATHTVLPGQQWDEISTWRENGGNGSWRHAAWEIWLPNSLAPGATYTVEFVVASGAYLQTSHQPLSALCSGPGAHDFKIDLADVRNQDDTARDSGHAIFRVCDNIANMGRDALQHLRAGTVVDEYRVKGLFVYAGTGHADPLLYADCILDLFTDASDGTSLKDIRHVCTVHNSWENVAAGSAGNPGNPGPAGFPKDPQVISYVPTIYDGLTDILDWKGLNATISSASNPIQASGGCGDTFQGNVTMTVPGSTGSNVWFTNQTVRVGTTGSAVGGLSPGRLYWVYPCGITSTGGANTTVVQLTDIPQVTTWGGHGVLTASQGSGTTTFSPVFWHSKFTSWLALDQSADENWATRGSTARFTRRIYPKFSTYELRYWEETGLFEPINLSQTPAVEISYGAGLYPLYNPFAKGVTLGTGTAGERPDLGFISEYQAQAQITETEHDWYISRLFTMGMPTHGISVVIDESNGLVPTFGNGPPTGPGGNGVGGTYTDPVTGFVIAPQPFTTIAGGYFGLATPLQNVPNSSVSWECGLWAQCGTYVAWQPSFDSYSYMVFGSRQFLDLIYYQANRDMLQLQTGNQPYYRDRIVSGNHYWGLSVMCCQTRGSSWTLRDRTYAAALGGDNNIERTIFNDGITENLNFYTQQLGPGGYGAGSNNLYTSIAGTDEPGSWTVTNTFQLNYVALATWGMDTFLHAPVENYWLAPLQYHIEGVCGHRMFGAPPPYYCIDYTYAAAIHDGDSFNRGGTATNGVDASDWGNNTYTTCIRGGGIVSQCGGLFYTLTQGDLVKNEAPAYDNGQKIDQLPGTQWFTIINPDNTNNRFQIQCPIGHAVDATCPTPGAAFTDFTSGGVSVANSFADYMLYRPSIDPGVGYARGDYASYGGNIMELLKITGHDVTRALVGFNARGGGSFYNSASSPSQWWDDTIVVPGLPAVVIYGNQFPTISCSAAPGTVVSSLGLVQGNNNAASGWAVTGIGDTTDFAISGNNLVVAPSAIAAGNCNTSEVVQVRGTQSGGSTVLGQINIRIGS